MSISVIIFIFVFVEEKYNYFSSFSLRHQTYSQYQMLQLEKEDNFKHYLTWHQKIAYTLSSSKHQIKIWIQKLNAFLNRLD